MAADPKKLKTDNDDKATNEPIKKFDHEYKLLN